MSLSLSHFDYHLPSELIAQHPALERTASRLLYLNHGQISDHHFYDLSQFLRPNDVLVLNDTRVIKARLLGMKDSGGKVEVLIERVINEHEAMAQIRASHPPKPHSLLTLASNQKVQVLNREGEFYKLKFETASNVYELLEQQGSVPLPPYIEHVANVADRERYQTVYAREPGAVAAPTAGLHFDQALLQRLQQQHIVVTYITLHVASGTFQPLRVTNVLEHKMHSEQYSIPQVTVNAIEHAKQRSGRVVAVGTTSLRALETATINGKLQAGVGETKLFITPGYRFQIVDRLVTNFHLPRSTLLMLVSAFAGIDSIRHAYQHAIQQRYRFFSYGDAMLIERAQST